MHCWGKLARGQSLGWPAVQKSVEKEWKKIFLATCPVFILITFVIIK